MTTVLTTHGSQSLSEAADQQKRRIAALLLAMAVIVVGSHVILDRSYDARADLPAVVDLASRQRMLSQRIFGLAEAHVAQINIYSQDRLVASLDEFERGHLALVHGTEPDRVSRPVSVSLGTLLAGNDGLEARHHAFTERARRVATWRPGQPRPTDDLALLAREAGGPLLDQLDAALTIEVRAADDALVADRQRAKALGVLAVVGLGLLGLLVVRPLSRSMHATSETLRRNEVHDARRRVWQRDFAAIADHELRTPVTVVSGLSLTLHRHWSSLDDDARLDIVRRLAEQGAVMAELLDELSTVAGLASPPNVDHRIDLVDMVEDIRAGRTTVMVEASSHMTIAADPRRIATLIRELVDNGLEHGAAPVTVGLHRRDAELVLVVKDRGDGIPSSDIDELLQPFSIGGQSENHGRVSGRGLGLSMVAAIVDEFDGTLSYDHSDRAWRIHLPGLVMTTPALLTTATPIPV